MYSDTFNTQHFALKQGNVVPKLQFAHATIDQVHRIIAVVEGTLKVFLNV